MAGIDSNTEQLYHMEDALDSSGNNKTLSFTNGASVSSTQKKWGSNSLYLNKSSSQFASVNNNDVVDMSLTQQTVDFWMRADNANSGRQCLLMKGRPQSWDVRFTLTLIANGQLHAKYTDSNGNLASPDHEAYSGRNLISSGEWYHIAYVKVSNSLTHVYCDGQVALSINTSTYPSNYWDTMDFYGMDIGRESTDGGNYFGGYIDEFRWSNNVVRWSTKFIAPSGPYDATSYHISGSVDRPCTIKILDANDVIVASEYTTTTYDISVDYYGEYQLLAVPDVSDVNTVIYKGIMPAEV